MIINKLLILHFRHIKSTTIYGGITSLDMHKDGSTLAIGTANGNVQLHDLRSKFDEPFFTFNAHTSLHCLKFLYEIKQQKLDNEATTIRKSNSVTLDSNSRILINKSNTILNGGAQQQPSFINDTTIMNLKDTSSQFSFNMYSPDCPNLRAESTLQSQKQQQSTTTSSFILHKNNSNNNIDNLTPITHTTTSPSTPIVPSNGYISNKANIVLNNKNLNLKSKFFILIFLLIKFASFFFF